MTVLKWEDEDAVMFDSDLRPNADDQDAAPSSQERSTPLTTAVSGQDEASRLKGLAAEIRDQDDLERDVNRQADRLLTEQANERDLKRLEKTQAEKARVEVQLRRARQRQSQSAASSTGIRLASEISRLTEQIQSLDSDLKQISERIDQRQVSKPDAAETEQKTATSRRLPNESQRDFLIRTGKITPFSRVSLRSQGRSDSTLEGVLLDAEEEEEEEEALSDVDPENYNAGEDLRSHRNLVKPGFSRERDDNYDEFDAVRPRKKRIVQKKVAGSDNGESLEQEPVQVQYIRSDDENTDEEYFVANSSEEDSEVASGSDSEQISEKVDFSGVDDGNEKVYERRLRDWVTKRKKARLKARGHFIDIVDTSNQASADQSAQTHEEWCLPHPTAPDTSIEGGFTLQGDIHPALFDYQKTGVRWLWELYSQSVGGIIGDEMGLGKTIQVIAFLAGLHYSKKLTKPVIIVVPTTVMKQWVSELHTWWPPFRVSILHSSGSGMMNLAREAREEDELVNLPLGRSKAESQASAPARRIVNRVLQDGHILVTSYSGLQTYAELLLPVEWEYAVLDEGHMIKNPNTAITIYSKELKTPNRIILSGTPMQNNLVELWSLFDFIFPMRLGTLVNFRNQFEIPIRIGGYANASNLQVQTAMKCAEMLKNTISPYLLQRFKADVASDLPQKSEQVLFCKLTKTQRAAYENFLSSDELKSIMNGKRRVLFGVDILRKICNHPDLVEHKTLSLKPGYNYGSGLKSGKMQVVKALLELWKEQGHKTLLFTQHRIMLDILEKFLKPVGGIKYRRMDGTTNISVRQNLVDEFNKNPEIHVFLLTTRVGGLGVNLTGADRVIIYDPDWNPSTDVQARERAWRLGQKREVMIYRLMTAGTIEEKIYHRQLFKQFLINKILRDPKQRQTFQMKDLHDLFTLGGDNIGTTETGELFQGTEVHFEQSATKDDQATQTQEDEELNGNGTTVDDLAMDRIAGVAHTEHFQSRNDNRKAEGASGGINSESRLMEGLFARSGVQSALEHDQIVNGKQKVVADRAIIEKEALRLASEAARELRKAGEVARQVPIGTPTWTGEFGVAGRPTTSSRGFGRGRGGPSSASVLAGLQARQSTSTLQSRSSTPDSTSSGATPRGVDFMKMIRNFLRVHGGAAPTQMLIDHFNRFCKTPARTSEFKAMLTELATLQKGTGGRGKWLLKAEYRDSSA